MVIINDMIKLKEAFLVFKKVEKRTNKTYESFRKLAKRYEWIHIFEEKIEVFKIGRTWYVNESQLRKEILDYENHHIFIEKVTEDYSNGIFHGNDDELMTTTWGGYQKKGQYRYVWNDYERYRKKRDGYWMCNTCNEVVEDYGKCEICSSSNR